MRQHQRATTTSAGRSIPLIREIAHAIRGIEQPRVLSLGCSEGYEPIDIASEIPSASVYGCDVNEMALIKAIDRCAPHGISIFHSTPENITSNGPYDAIAAFSVLCRYPDSNDRDNIADLYSFSDFDEAIVLLVGQLKVGGVLSVFNANYYVEHTSASDLISPIIGKVPNNGFARKFLPSGELAARSSVCERGEWFSKEEWRSRFPDWRARQQEYKAWYDAGQLGEPPRRFEPLSVVDGAGDNRVIHWRKVA